MDYYTYLSTESLQILTGLCLSEEEEEEAPPKFSDLPTETTETSTPLLILKLGMRLKERTHSYIRYPVSSSKDNKERQDYFIEQAAKVLTRRLNQIPILKSQLCGKTLDAIDTKVIALLFSKKMASSYADLDDVFSAMKNLEEGLEAVRRIRNGSSLGLSGLVENIQKSYVELSDEVFDLLLNHSGEEGRTCGDSPLLVFENRIKSSTQRKKPNGNKEGDDPEYVFRN